SRHAIVFFDNDDAGRSGSDKLVELLLKKSGVRKVSTFDWSLFPNQNDAREVLNVDDLDFNKFEQALFNGSSENKTTSLLRRFIREKDFYLKPPIDYDPINKRLVYLTTEEKESLVLCSGMKVEVELLNEGQYHEDDFLKTSIKTSKIEHISSEKLGELIEKSEDDLGLYEDIYSFLKKFIYFEDDYNYHLCSLYVLLSYVWPIFDYVGLLNLNGLKASGKSVLAQALSLISFNSIHAAPSTSASIRRIIHEKRGLYSMDDCEILSTNASETQEFRSQLCASYKTNEKFTMCNMNKGNKVDEFYLGGPKIINGINQLEGTLDSRCIRINTVKAPNDFKKVKLPKVTDETILDLRTRGIYFGLKSSNELVTLKDSISVDLPPTRASDLKLPLLTISRFFDNKLGNEDFGFLREEAVGEALSQAIDEKSNDLFTIDDFVLNALKDLVQNTTEKYENSIVLSLNEICDEVFSIEISRSLYNRRESLPTKVGMSLRRLDVVLSTERKKVDHNGKQTFYQIDINQLDRL
ncbi:hypothetical protein N9N67_10995, partial [Bacteriovoracaceae bacterium]|nr:hypothetical protein [Bacteriovoracaceae bacterium]